MRGMTAKQFLASFVGALFFSAALSGQDVHRSFDWPAPASASSAYGYLITVVGDVDLDGRDDVAVSDPGWGGTRGRVSIYRSSGLPALTLDGPAPVFSDSFGTAVESAGDLNLDGIPDLVIGHPALGGGAVYLVSGADGNVLLTMTAPSAQTEFGISVSAFSDITADGVGEILVGIPSITLFGPGRVELRNGVTGAVLYSANSPLEVANPTLTNTNWFGANICRLNDDADGDGFEDFVASDVIAGHVICSGATGQAIAWSADTAPQGGVRRLRGLGADIDGDGVYDFLAACSSCAGAGELRSGATGALIRSHAGGANGLGSSATALGDLDGDGVPDYAFGSFAFDASEGARVFSGATGNLLWTIEAEPGEIGGAVTLDGPADVNGDGYSDVVLASGALGSAQIARAYSYVRHGRYGFANGQLDVDFVRSTTLSGDLVITGAVPNAPCLLAASLIPAQSVFSAPPVSIWVDLNPSALILLEGFPFPLSSSLSIPIALDDPFVVDIALFFQAFDLSGYPSFASVSNGLFVVFAP